MLPEAMPEKVILLLLQEGGLGTFSNEGFGSRVCPVLLGLPMKAVDAYQLPG